MNTNITPLTDFDALIQSPHFRWMPGMLDSQGFRLCSVSLHDGAWDAIGPGGTYQRYYYPTHPYLKYPDINDASTQGCLLAIARIAWGSDADIQVKTEESECCIDVSKRSKQLFRWVGHSLGEGLVSTILSAPDVVI
tara:strand:+ start:7223 stop:7633 length:411 start_codon:yes stop_codon:yes gene_type:complete